MIPERVRTWAQVHCDQEITAVDPLRGGLTDTIYAVRFAHGPPVILRYAPIERWGDLGRRHVRSEAIGCRLLAGSGLPVPRLIASDADGSTSGGYANLSTWLPGTVRLGPLGLDAIDELARVAVVIHATPVDPARRPPPYAFWTPAEPAIPAWARRPELWRTAIAVFTAGPPPARPGLLHRDFHPGNILWDGDQITGVIDWAETSWGPPDLDVVHAVTNFALLHDRTSAYAFAAAYRRHGGLVEDDPEAARFWAVSDILGFLPDPAPLVIALTSHRRDLSADLVRARLERLLMLTLAGAAGS